MSARSLSLWASLVLLAWAARASAQATKISDDSKPALEALRGVAQRIGECPKVLEHESRWGKQPDEIERFYYMPPDNVTWDVVSGSSVRAPYMGYIEFAVRLDHWVPETAQSRYDRSSAAAGYLLAYGGSSDWQFRYEYDLGPSGLQLIKGLSRHNSAQEWLFDASDWGKSCWDIAARNTRARPSMLPEQPAPAPAQASPNVTHIPSGANIERKDQAAKQDDRPVPGAGSADIDKEPLEISGVEIGMTREIVLSGLANHYKLTKEEIDFGADTQLEVWSVEKKDAAASGNHWEIAFKKGTVVSVITRLSPTLHGDAVGLAQQLFAELYQRADMDPGAVAKIIGTRRIALEIELGQMTLGSHNEETIRFSFQNGTAFEIEIEAPVASAPYVNTSDFKSE